MLATFISCLIIGWCVGVYFLVKGMTGEDTLDEFDNVIPKEQVRANKELWRLEYTYH